MSFEFKELVEYHRERSGYSVGRNCQMVAGCGQASGPVAAGSTHEGQYQSLLTVLQES